MVSSSTVNTSLISFGTIVTPTPVSAPSSISIANNLAAIPEAWQVGQEGSVLDYEVFHTIGQPSIRFGDGSTPRHQLLQEVNTGWIPVEAGDHIVFGCWIKTDPSPIGQGGIIGLDLYGPTQRLWEVAPKVSGDDQENFIVPKDWDYVYVPYDSDWTYLELDFIVPSKLFDYDDYNEPRNPPEYAVGIIPWLTPSWSDGETAKVWFADAVLYINP